MLAPAETRSAGRVAGSVNGFSPGIKPRDVSISSIASSTVSTSPQLQSEMRRLQEDIAQRTEELSRLQNVAKAVRMPEVPRKVSPAVPWNQSNARGVGMEISGNAEQKPRRDLTSPHAKTSKVIGSLQSTIDGLKRNLHHERTAREADTKLIAALNKRVESSGDTNERLSQQMHNYSSMESRKSRKADESERALKVERDKCAQKQAEVQLLREKVTELHKEVARERGKRECIDVAYNTLRRATGEKGRTVMVQVRQEVKELKALRAKDCTDMQRLSELSALQKTENAKLKHMADSMTVLHDEQKAAIAALVEIVRLHFIDTMEPKEEVHWHVDETIEPMEEVS